MLAGRSSVKPVQKVKTLSDPTGFFDLPAFLCPTLLRPGYYPGWRSLLKPKRIDMPYSQTRSLHSIDHELRTQGDSVASRWFLRLPQQCSGCGALSQVHDGREPGFYSLERRSVKKYLNGTNDLIQDRRSLAGQMIQDALSNTDNKLLVSQCNEAPGPTFSSRDDRPPLCDRCHKLLHHHTGNSIHHPSIDAIRDTLEESPHKYNHVYHILDAADFPMSLIPGLQRLLNVSPLRSQNRRSKTGRYFHGKKFEVSFVITRSDLLAPLKSQVDSLMPYMTTVLRDALGSLGKNVRLGNVRCVSAKRGWWTKELKEEIWQHGGGGWMVGKVNVGKSQLFESVFPKGRRGVVKLGQPLEAEVSPLASEGAAVEDVDSDLGEGVSLQQDQWEESVTDTSWQPSNDFTLLPPPQPETDYPAMPLVSSLPGTTASPIRIPFGTGKGELVDLPGLSRGDLEVYVQEEYRPSLVMKSRVIPEQQVIKPGQSLLLGGLIRITPTDPDLILMAYSFMPISSHLTSTEKAIGIQMQDRDSGVENIGKAGIGEKLKSAGKFALQWDVTKQRSGPITASYGAGMKIDRLPYRVLSTDILVEGCGWVELVAQVRKRAMKAMDNSVTFNRKGMDEKLDTQVDLDPTGFQWPEVEVFSPDGHFIGARRPMGAWMLGQKKAASRMKSRPRRSMKGAKKNSKANNRRSS